MWYNFGHFLLVIHALMIAATDTLGRQSLWLFQNSANCSSEVINVFKLSDVTSTTYYCVTNEKLYLTKIHSWHTQSTTIKHQNAQCSCVISKQVETRWWHCHLEANSSLQVRYSTGRARNVCTITTQTGSNICALKQRKIILNYI